MSLYPASDSPWCQLRQAADGNQTFDVYVKHHLNIEECQRKDYYPEIGAPIYVLVS